jgi:hypothetical protein
LTQRKIEVNKIPNNRRGRYSADDYKT